MTCHILGLGPTIKDFREYDGYRIGVNDISRHTYADRIICVNRLPQERAQWVIDSRPEDGLWSNLNTWSTHHSYRKLTFRPWHGIFKEKTIFSSKSSPFIAYTMAYSLGFKEIILWGVDFIDHPNIKNRTKDQEIRNFALFYKEIKKRGVNTFVGSSGSELIKIIPLWEQ